MKVYLINIDSLKVVGVFESHFEAENMVKSSRRNDFDYITADTKENLRCLRLEKINKLWGNYQDIQVTKDINVALNLCWSMIINLDKDRYTGLVHGDDGIIKPPKRDKLPRKKSVRSDSPSSEFIRMILLGIEKPEIMDYVKNKFPNKNVTNSSFYKCKSELKKAGKLP